MAKIRNVKKLKLDNENDLIVKDQMADLGCLLVCTFGLLVCTSVLLVLVAVDTVNNLDLGYKQIFLKMRAMKVIQ